MGYLIMALLGLATGFVGTVALYHHLETRDKK